MPLTVRQNWRAESGEGMNELLGVLRKAPDGTATVHFDRYFTAGADALWNAATHPERLGEWFATVEGDLREHGTFTITIEGRDPERCRVIACSEQRMFSFEWAMPQPTLVRVHIIPDNTGSRLELTHERLTRADGPRCAASWDAFLHVLSDHLGGGSLRSWSEGVDAVRVAYLQQLLD